MYKCQQQVHEFHQMFKYRSGTLPKKLTKKQRLHRARLMREEIREFLEAKDIVSQVDALDDLLYFLLGTADEMGVDLEPTFDKVHEANMRKLGPDGQPIYRVDGKIMKPEGWVGPEAEIMGEIIKQQQKANG
jgi:predicted HAD superfamily Cof-like phosphohydrolase